MMMPGSTKHSMSQGATSSRSEETPSRLAASERVSSYLRGLFPFLSWINRYDSTWLAADLVAGITVGAIVVPQGMAYASLAKLDPEFGLYSSFVGVMLYWLFGTSKDISIGPVAVLSTVVGNLINQVHASDPEVPSYAIAASLSVLTGLIVLIMGLLRCGWVVNLVSAPSLAAFMTGSAITITTSQVPSILGLTGFSSRESPYKVVVNIVTRLDQANINAILGISALIVLYLARFSLTLAAERSPKHRRAFQMLNSMRSVSVIVVYTVISWIAHWSTEEEQVFNILGDIPQGFQHLGTPPVEMGLLATIVPYIPATLVVMLVEHMAIGKSFGRANNYIINASQEMIALGVTNLVGPFFGGYSSTGSFSRTAIQSKAGARSPMAGLITGVVVLLAIHLLTAAFYYIPSAVLSAVVVHAVGDLVTPLSVLGQYWLVSPIELLVFAVGVLASIAKSIETGLYASVALSTAALLCRTVSLHSQKILLLLALPLAQTLPVGKEACPTAGHYGTFEEQEPRCSTSFALNFKRSTNTLPGQSSPPGVIVHRLPQDVNYMNSAGVVEELMYLVRAHMSPADHDGSLLRSHEPQVHPSDDMQLDQSGLSTTSLLEAVVLDFHQVRNIDATAIQHFVDLKKQLDGYAVVSPKIQWQLERIRVPQVLRALQGADLMKYEEEGHVSSSCAFGTA